MENAGQGRIADVMKSTFYVGNKVILAYPTTLGKYQESRGWDDPKGDSTEEVYLVEYEPVHGQISNMSDKGHSGYVTMSPKHVFDDAYRENGALDFGSAILATKRDNMIRRSGWPKGHFVFRQIPSIIKKDIVPKMQSLPDSVKAEFQKRFDDKNSQIDAIYYDNQLAYVGDSNLICSYAPSPEDCLMEDWLITE